MKIMLTGASGLLGAEIAGRLKTRAKELSIDNIILHRQSVSTGFLSADMKTQEGLDLIADQDWDVIIHTAAEKDPDSCEKDKYNADILNVAATKFLAEKAAERGAYFIYISTDYVFPGTNPPYDEDAEPAPINYYGSTKLRGEVKVLDASPSFCSLRVPILYGTAAGVEHSALLAGSVRMLLDSKEKMVDDTIVRYPTYTGDVADAVVLLLKKRGSGIYHCSGKDKSTKYQVCVDIAHVLGLSHAHIFPQENPPSSGARRPYDCHLNMKRLNELGFDPVMPLHDRLMSFRKELSKYLNTL